MRQFVRLFFECIALARKFREYRPRRITAWSIYSYLRQYDPSHRLHALTLLKGIMFITRENLLNLMVQEIKKIVERADSDGIPAYSVVIVPASLAGQSSREIHGELSKDPRIKDFNVSLFDGNPMQLAQLIKKMSDPIVVFVDDFAGTGQQFIEAHKGWSSAIQPYSPVTYFVACVMCTPAITKVTVAGVIPSPGVEHKQEDMFERYSHQYCGFDGHCILMSYATEIHSRWPLGFNNMGAMTVIYRNSANNMPFLLRGTQGQRVWRGLFPRIDQLLPTLRKYNSKE